MNRTRRPSAVDPGGRPLGLDPGGLLVDGLTYLQIKCRLGLIQPAMLGPTSPEQRHFVGGEPIVADLSRPRPGRWVQPTMLSVWTKAERDEYEEASDDMRIVLSAATARRLEEVET